MPRGKQLEAIEAEAAAEAETEAETEAAAADGTVTEPQPAEEKPAKSGGFFQGVRNSIGRIVN